MSLTQKILYNTAVQLIGKILSTAAGLIAMALMMRYLGQEGFGAFTTVTAFVQFAGILIDMGLSLVAIQLISESQENPKRNYNNIFTFRCVSALFLYGLSPIIALAFPYSQTIKIGIAITAVSFFLSSLIQILTVPFQVHFRMISPMIADGIGRVFLVIGTILVIQFDTGFSGILWIVTFANALQIFFLFLFLRPITNIRLAFEWMIWKKILIRSWPIALSIVFNLVYLKLDTIILSLVRPQSDVGLYGAAYRVFEVLMTLPIMFMGVALGSFARAWSSGNKELFCRYFQKTFDFIAIIAIPMVIGTLFLATPIMLFIGGKEFQDAGPILSILIIALGFVFFGTVSGHLINVVNEQKRMILGYLAGAIVGIVGYLFFIPKYSYWGAAWMTVVVECIVMGIGFVLFLRKISYIPSFSIFIKSTAACALMGGILILTPSLNFAIRACVGGIVYFCALYMLGGISKNQLSLLFSKKI